MAVLILMAVRTGAVTLLEHRDTSGAFVFKDACSRRWTPIIPIDGLAH
jgi:hypothetical protein